MGTDASAACYVKTKIMLNISCQDCVYLCTITNNIHQRLHLCYMLIKYTFSNVVIVFTGVQYRKYLLMNNCLDISLENTSFQLERIQSDTQRSTSAVMVCMKCHWARSFLYKSNEWEQVDKRDY